MARDFEQALKAATTPMRVPDPAGYTYGASQLGQPGARSWSQVITSASDGDIDATPDPKKKPKPGPPAEQRQKPDWRGHYLGEPMTMQTATEMGNLIRPELLGKAAETLYAHRPLVNAQELYDWAKAAGIPNLVPPHEMHVTTIYSRAGKPAIEPRTDQVIAKRNLAPLGPKGAFVLHFESPELQEQHRQAMEAGASHDWPSYQTHVTLSYDTGGKDFSGLEAPKFPLVFGPEKFAPINDNWAKDKGLKKFGKARTFNDLVYKFDPSEPRDQDGKWTYGGGSSAGAPTKDKPVALVFGGSFNPPTTGHIAAINDAIHHVKSQGYQVGKVVVVPTADKLISNKLADRRYPLAERVALTRATMDESGIPGVEVSGEPSEQAEAFQGKLRRTQLADWAREKYPGHTVIAVTGSDAAPGPHPPAPAIYQGAEGTSHAGYHYLVVSRDDSGSGVSSTKVRNALRETGKVPAGMMTPKAEAMLPGVFERHPEIVKRVVSFEEKIGKGAWGLPHDHLGNRQKLRLPIADRPSSTVMAPNRPITPSQGPERPLFQTVPFGASNMFKDFNAAIGKAGFDPSQPRDETGEWTYGGGSIGTPHEHVATALFHANHNPNLTHEHIHAAQAPEVQAKLRDAEQKIASLKPTDHPEAGHKVDGVWTPEREAIHDQILSKLFTKEAVENATPAPGEKPVAIFLGGRGGSGKSWLTSKDGPVDASKAIYLNSDDFKEQLPGYEGWNAAAYHEESSEILAKAEQIAAGAKLNIIYDATMKTQTSAAERLAKLQTEGYDVKGYYMFASPETAAHRAVGRFIRGGEKGRYVPPRIVLGSTTNERTFDALKPSFSDWAIYDNNGGPGSAPKLIAKGKH